MSFPHRDRAISRAVGLRNLVPTEWHTREIFSKQTQIRLSTNARKS